MLQSTEERLSTHPFSGGFSLRYKSKRTQCLSSERLARIAGSVSVVSASSGGKVRPRPFGAPSAYVWCSVASLFRAVVMALALPNSASEGATLSTRSSVTLDLKRFLTRCLSDDSGCWLGWRSAWVARPYSNDLRERVAAAVATASGQPVARQLSRWVGIACGC